MPSVPTRRSGAPKGFLEVSRAVKPLFNLSLTAGLAGAAFYYAQASLNHDTSFLLEATRQWLGGAVLYRDIMEINPPLIFYLTAPALFLSNLLNTTPTTAFIILICVAAGCSLIWCERLLRRILEISAVNRYLIVIACLLGLIFSPAGNFGQREHLFVIFALPYLMAVSFSPTNFPISVTEKLALGLFAVFGIALKPYFLIPPLFLNAAICWQRRSLRPLYDPMNMAIVLGCIVYGLFLARFHSEYLTTVLPIGMRVYGAIGNGLGIISRLTLPGLLIIAVATMESSSSSLRNSLNAFAALLLGLLIAFIVQFKGWPYQLLPFDSIAIIVCVIAAALSSSTLRSKPLHFAFFAVLPALVIAQTAFSGRYQNLYAEVFAQKLEQIRSDWTGKSILLLSTDDFAAFPLINELGAEWAGRYPYQWIVAGAISTEAIGKCKSNPDSCTDVREIIEYGRRTNVDDLANQHPDVVLVDERPLKPYFPDEPSFDYIDFLSADSRFAEIWSHYRKVSTALNYSIWVRNP